MAREAALTARLGLDDGDFTRSVGRQGANYNKLLAANEQFKKKLAAQNDASRSRELAAEKAHYEKLSAQHRASAFLTGGPTVSRSSLDSTLEADARAAGMKRAGVSAVGMNVTGLKLKQQEAFVDPAYVNRASLSMQGLASSTLTANAAMMQGKGGATNAGMAMLMLSQTADDAQYGFRSIVNNLGPLVMALGGGPGLAGILTITAVGFNILGDAAKKAWDDMTGETAYQKLLQQNEMMEQQHQMRLQMLEVEAAQRGDLAAANARDVAEYEGRIRADRLHTFQVRMQQTEAEQAIARAKVEGMDSLSKEVKLNELTKKQTAEKLAMERAFFEERLTNLQNATRFTGNRQTDERDLRTLEQEQRDAAAKPDHLKSAADKRREKALPGLIEAEKTRLDQVGAAFDADSKALRSIKEKQAAQKLENELKDAELDIQLAKQGEQMARDGMGAVIGFFKRVQDHAVAANDADEKAWQKVQAAQRKRDQQQRSMDELQVKELRAGGKNKEADALEAQMKLRAKTAAYKEEGFTDAQAGQMAARDAAAEASGKRPRGKIRGAVSKNLRTGLDGEWHGDPADFAGMQDMSRDYFGLKEASTQKRTQQNLKLQKVNEGIAKAEQSGDKATVTELRELKKALVAKLDELNGTTKGPVADQTKSK